MACGTGELASAIAVAEPSTAYRESYTPSVDRYQVNIDSSIGIS